MPRRKHLIAGAWIGFQETFASHPVTGKAQHLASGGAAELDRARA